MLKTANIVALAVIILVTLSCKKAIKKGTDTKKAQVEIEVLIVEPHELNNIIKTTGNLFPAEMVELKSEVAGRIDKLAIQEGKLVKAGALLVQFDDSELQAQLRKLQAQLKLAVETESRKKELLAINGIAKVEYDEAFTNLETIKADIDLTQSKIRKSRIVAPFDGTIGLRNVSQGAYVSIGTIISTLVQLNPLKMEFKIPEKYAPYIKDGMLVEFTTAANTKTFNAKIYAFQSQIEEDSRSLTVRAITPNSKGELIPGAFADVSILLEKIDNATMIPTYCLVPLLSGQNVFVIKAGIAYLAKVETGIRTEDQIQIISGVNAGDTIATTGLLALKNKMPITIKKIITE